MANLLFKRGSYERLFHNEEYNNGPLPLNEGTVYFTTDEGGMYIDTDSARVRIQGSVKYYDTLDNFMDMEKPPYASDVLYFIAKANGQDANALLHWDPDGGEDGKGCFVQVNVTAAYVEALEKIVNNNTKAIQQSSELITGLRTDVDANTDDIALLTARLDLIDGGSGTTSGGLADILNRIDALEGTVGNNESGLVKAVADVTDKADQNQEAIAAIQENYVKKTDYNSDKEVIDNKFAAVNSAASALTDRVDTLTTVVGDANSGLVKAVNEVTSKANNNSELITGLRTDLTKTNEDLTALTTRVTTAEGDINDLKGRMTANETLAQTGADTAAAALEKANDNSDSIVNITNKLGALDAELPLDATNVIDALNKLNTKANDLSGSIGTNYEAIQEHDTAIKALQDIIGEGDEGLQADVTKLKSDVSDHGDAIAELQQKKADASALQSAVQELNDSIGVVDEAYKAADAKIREDFAAADSALTEEIGKSNDAIAKLQQDKADASALQSAVQELNSSIQSTKNEFAAADTKIREDFAAANSALDGKISANAEAISALQNNKADKTYVDSEIAEKIAAANAMVFRDDYSVADADDYDTIKALEDVSIGHTFIVTSDFKYDDNLSVHAGDLLVATGIEGESGYIISGLDFIVVDTGYVAAHSPSLILEGAVTNRSATMTLKDHVNASLGAINISTSTGSTETDGGLKISGTGTDKNYNLTIDMVWGEF